MSLGIGSDGIGGAPGTLSQDEVFTLLSNQRRRGVVHYLRREEGAAELREMAARIAAWEYGTDVEELSPDQRKRVYTSLQQTHLRKLDEAGIVEYDDDAARVHPTAATDELEVYLEVVPGREFPWREYYLALGAVSSALVIVAWIGVGVFAQLSGIALAGVIAAVFTCSAAAHVRHERTVQIGENEHPPDVAHDRNG